MVKRHTDMDNLMQGKVLELAKISYKIMQTSFKAFMGNKALLLEDMAQEINNFNYNLRGIYLPLITDGKNTADVKSGDAAKILEALDYLELINNNVALLKQQIEKKIKEKVFFNKEALDEYEQIYLAAEDIFATSLEGLGKNDAQTARKIVAKVEHVAQQFILCHRAHIERLLSGKCGPRAGKIYVDMLYSLLQIAENTKRFTQLI